MGSSVRSAPPPSGRPAQFGVRARFIVEADERLGGDVDRDGTLADIPAEFAVRGMFFKRYVGALAGAWNTVAPHLLAPPAGGRYHTFEWYPMRDYVRVFDEVARARFPGSTREAYRLLARGDVEVFAQSTLGKVAFALLPDPCVALLRYPDLFAMVTKSRAFEVRRLTANRVVVSYESFFGSLEQGLGMVEGIVLGFEEKPRVEVVWEQDGSATLDVTW